MRTLILILTAISLSTCACAGNLSPGPKTEEEREMARVEVSQITAFIEYKYSRAQLKQFERSTYSRDYTTSETVELYVSSPKHKSPPYRDLPERPLYMGLYEDRNKEDRAKYRDKSAKIIIDAEDERVAYQLGDDPWQLVYLTPESLLHAPTGTLTSEPSDWSKIPTLIDHALPVWRAHDAGIGTYREGKRADLLQYIQDNTDDETRYNILASLIDHIAGSHERWAKAAKTLSPASQRRLVAELEAKPDAWKAPEYVQRHITEWMQAVKEME